MLPPASHIPDPLTLSEGLRSFLYGIIRTVAEGPGSLSNTKAPFCFKLETATPYNYKFYKALVMCFLLLCPLLLTKIQASCTPNIYFGLL